MFDDIDRVHQVTVNLTKEELLSLKSVCEHLRLSQDSVLELFVSSGLRSQESSTPVSQKILN